MKMILDRIKVVILLLAFSSIISPLFSEISFDMVVIDATNGGITEIEDIDGDGKNDIITAVGGSTPPTGFYWYQYPDWTRLTIANTEFMSDDFALADIDNDGDMDVVGVENSSNATPVWFENPGPAGDPKIGPWQKTTVGPSGTGYCKDIDAGDFNKDGKLDIAVRGQNGRTAVFIQQSPSSWNLVKTISHHPHEGMVLADLDKDDDDDIVLNGFWLETPSDLSGTWNEHSIDASWYSGQGTEWWSHNSYVDVNDINNDGKLDVIISHSGTSGFPVNWYEASDPTGTWTKHAVNAKVDYCQTLQTGDMDGDGDIDVVTAVVPGFSVPAEICVHINDNSIGTSWTKQVISTDGHYAARVGDIDNDGDPDIVGQRRYGNMPPITLWRNNSNPVSIEHREGNLDFPHSTTIEAIQRLSQLFLFVPGLKQASSIPVTIQIRDFLGRSVHDPSGLRLCQGATSIEFSPPSGMYLISVESANQCYIGKNIFIR